MKLQIELDGERFTLDLQHSGERSDYTLQGTTGAAGTASVSETMAGVFSVLLGRRSITVSIAQKGDHLEAWVNNRRHTIYISDARDRVGKGKRAFAAGPVELRAQMPGKVVKLLAQPGDNVRAGQGVLVVEAMKMQNEMKSPKDGTVAKVLVAEGATVSAGETLIVVE